MYVCIRFKLFHQSIWVLVKSINKMVKLLIYKRSFMQALTPTLRSIKILIWKSPGFIKWLLDALSKLSNLLSKIYCVGGYNTARVEP